MRLKKPYNYVEQVKRLQGEGIIVQEEKLCRSNSVFLLEFKGVEKR